MADPAAIENSSSGELQQALTKLFNHNVVVHGSGRTDAGVQRPWQMANVETSRTMDTNVRGLIALRRLPEQHF